MDWRRLIPDFVWRLYEAHNGIAPIVEGRVSKEEVGEIAPSDWMGTPILPGSVIVYPCDDYVKTTQMAEATVEEVRANGLTVHVNRRSRTGRPGDGQRERVRLTLVGVANCTVIA